MNNPLDKLDDALARIEGRCRAYPVTVFPGVSDEDLERVQKVLNDHLPERDWLSDLHGSWGRHILSGVQDYVKEARNCLDVMQAKDAIDAMPGDVSADAIQIPMNDQELLAYEGICAAMELAHQTASDAGWYRDPKTGAEISRNFGELISLMHSELSEALEAGRKGLQDDKLPHRDGREVEFADCIIRILDTARALGLDLAGAVIEKNRFNGSRADHKLKNRTLKGGKAY